MYYSATTNGFYDLSIFRGVIPADAVEISSAEHASLRAGEVAGQIITADPVSGMPVLSSPAPLLMSDVRASMQAESWKICRALTQIGLREVVEAEVAKADQDTQDMWNRARVFKRLSPFTLSLAAACGATPEKIDDLFHLANSIEE